MSSIGYGQQLIGREEPFPGPDNHSKMKRSCENAEHIGSSPRTLANTTVMSSVRGHSPIIAIAQRQRMR
ncbi:hypothetical protein CEP54_008248 [Fusarium duplospermum]|uniref:Uncharacterized protein n=1 Tax=Fusarium duplospermum TaxID=1325734 RepID=A0A428PWU8_9HYPO|nr:hypothetical protein CEP54_008248 [Fusarium duplospermum]